MKRAWWTVGHGGLPVAISRMVIPRDQMSALVPYVSVPFMTSGAMNCVVPTAVWASDPVPSMDTYTFSIP